MIAHTKVFGLDLVQAEADELAHFLLDASEKGIRIACANPYSLEVARDDPDFARALRESEVLLCDGAGLVLAARIFAGVRLKRLTGPALFKAINAELAVRGGSAFFLGGEEAWNVAMLERLAAQYPNLRTAAFAPPFKPAFNSEDIDEMERAIREFAPDVLWIGVGSPKQEKLMAELDRSLYHCAGAVGAAFDFTSGKSRRAPRLVRAVGLEWLYRLVRNPRRLGRRTFVAAPTFLWHSARNASSL